MQAATSGQHASQFQQQIETCSSRCYVQLYNIIIIQLCRDSVGTLIEFKRSWMHAAQQWNSASVRKARPCIVYSAVMCRVKNIVPRVAIAQQLEMAMTSTLYTRALTLFNPPSSFSSPSLVYYAILYQHNILSLSVRICIKFYCNLHAPLLIKIYHIIIIMILCIMP